jgi:hypothetical protein
VATRVEATRVEATDRRRLERLCRYVIRPPVAARRLRVIDDETLVFQLKTPLGRRYHLLGTVFD